MRGAARASSTATATNTNTTPHHTLFIPLTPQHLHLPHHTWNERFGKNLPTFAGNQPQENSRRLGGGGGNDAKKTKIRQRGFTKLLNQS